MWGQPPSAVLRSKAPQLSNDFNPHRPRRPAHTLHRRIHGRRIQIRHLLLRNILNLLQRDLSHFVFVGSARSLCNARRPLQQNRSRRSLSDERKRAVVINRDHHWNNQPFEFLLAGASVELLAEFHDVDLRLSKRRTNWRRRRRLARRNLQFHRTRNFFRHNFFLPQIMWGRAFTPVRSSRARQSTTPASPLA